MSADLKSLKMVAPVHPNYAYLPKEGDAINHPFGIKAEQRSFLSQPELTSELLAVARTLSGYEEGDAITQHFGIRSKRSPQNELLAVGPVLKSMDPYKIYVRKSKHASDDFDLAEAEADPRKLQADPWSHISERRSKRDANPDDFDLAEAEADPRRRSDNFDMAKAEADPKRRSDDFDLAEAEADPKRLHLSKRNANPDDFDLAEAEADPRRRYDDFDLAEAEADPRRRSDDFDLAEAEADPRRLHLSKRNADPFDLAEAEADPRRVQADPRRVQADPRLHLSVRRGTTSTGQEVQTILEGVKIYE